MPRRTRNFRDYGGQACSGCACIGGHVSIGAAMPLLTVVIAPASVFGSGRVRPSLGFLALLGTVGAKAVGAHIQRATIRVTF
jgi:VIT1/CCC1 family predicted Fe2+/Mn2+ transporter